MTNHETSFNKHTNCSLTAVKGTDGICASSPPAARRRCDRSRPPLLSATSGRAFVVYNMDDEVDVDIEGDEFQSKARWGTCPIRRIELKQHLEQFPQRWLPLSVRSWLTGRATGVATGVRWDQRMLWKRRFLTASAGCVAVRLTTDVWPESRSYSLRGRAVLGFW